MLHYKKHPPALVRSLRWHCEGHFGDGRSRNRGLTVRHGLASGPSVYDSAGMAVERYLRRPVGRGEDESSPTSGPSGPLSRSKGTLRGKKRPF